MTHQPLSPRDIEIRYYIYSYFHIESQAPLPRQLAVAFGMNVVEVEASYQRLHDNHLLFVEPCDSDIHPGQRTLRVRMANPFSGIPTPFTATLGMRRYYANCAWDMLGIPAMLGRGDIAKVPDAYLEGEMSDTGEAVSMSVENGQVSYDGPAVIHFPLPLRQWYDDLVLT